MLFIYVLCSWCDGQQHSRYFAVTAHVWIGWETIWFVNNSAYYRQIYCTLMETSFLPSCGEGYTQSPSAFSKISLRTNAEVVSESTFFVCVLIGEKVFESHWHKVDTITFFILWNTRNTTCLWFLLYYLYKYKLESHLCVSRSFLWFNELAVIEWLRSLKFYILSPSCVVSSALDRGRSWLQSDFVVFLSLQSSGDESAVLWLDQIQEAIHTANQEEEEALTRGWPLSAHPLTSPDTLPTQPQHRRIPVPDRRHGRLILPPVFRWRVFQMIELSVFCKNKSWDRDDWTILFCSHTRRLRSCTCPILGTGSTEWPCALNQHFPSVTSPLSLCVAPVAGAVADINKMVAEGDPQKTLQALQAPSAGLRAVLSECADTYQSDLGQRQAESAARGKPTARCHQTKSIHTWSRLFYVHLLLISGTTDSVWVKHAVKDKYDYYYNLETGDGTWEEPEGFEHNSGQLSKEEIQVKALYSCFCSS